MKHIAAYLLLLVGGNAAPTADDIKKVLSAGGVEADDEALTRLMTAVDGKVRVLYYCCVFSIFGASRDAYRSTAGLCSRRVCGRGKRNANAAFS